MRANIWHWCSCIEELIVFNAGGSYFTHDTFDKARVFFRRLKSYFRTQADASSRLNERARDVVGFLPRIKELWKIQTNKCFFALQASWKKDLQREVDALVRRVSSKILCFGHDFLALNKTTAVPPRLVRPLYWRRLATNWSTQSLKQNDQKRSLINLNKLINLVLAKSTDLILKNQINLKKYINQFLKKYRTDS